MGGRVGEIYCGVIRMTRVGILMFQNMRYAPFLKLYEDILGSMLDVSYDVIYFERDSSLGEIKDENHIAIDWLGKGTLSAPGYERLINFGLYSSKVKRILKRNKYNFLIILTTFPAVLLGGYLSKYYNNRYLVDIRDYTHEGFAPYFKLETQVLRNAAMRVISSPGFVNFLPRGEYVICHNLDARTNVNERLAFSKAKNRPIVISYIGTISYKALCMKLISLVEKDERFEFHFYGNEADGTEIGDYVRELNCSRIRAFGPFCTEQKRNIYSNSDMVFNCYGNDSSLVKYALSNKYYDGALYRRPLLVSPNTSMAEHSGEFAYALDLDSVVNLDSLFEWYIGIDEVKYLQYSDKVLQEAMIENQHFIRQLAEMIESIGAV